MPVIPRPQPNPLLDVPVLGRALGFLESEEPDLSLVNPLEAPGAVGAGFFKNLLGKVFKGTEFDPARRQILKGAMAAPIAAGIPKGLGEVLGPEITPFISQLKTLQGIPSQGIVDPFELGHIGRFLGQFGLSPTRAVQGPGPRESLLIEVLDPSGRSLVLDFPSAEFSEIGKGFVGGALQKAGLKPSVDVRKLIGKGKEFDPFDLFAKVGHITNEEVMRGVGMSEGFLNLIRGERMDIPDFAVRGIMRMLKGASSDVIELSLADFPVIATKGELTRLMRAPNPTATAAFRSAARRGLENNLLVRLGIYGKEKNTFRKSLRQLSLDELARFHKQPFSENVVSRLRELLGIPGFPPPQLTLERVLGAGQKVMDPIAMLRFGKTFGEELVGGLERLHPEFLPELAKRTKGMRAVEPKLGPKKPKPVEQELLDMLKDLVGKVKKPAGEVIEEEFD